jgi:hypothetical protein
MNPVVIFLLLLISGSTMMVYGLWRSWRLVRAAWQRGYETPDEQRQAFYWLALTLFGTLVALMPVRGL